MEILTSKPLRSVLTRAGSSWRLSLNLDIKEITDTSLLVDEQGGRLMGDDGEPLEVGYVCSTATAILAERPTEQDIRQLITSHYDAETDERILSGFRWRDMPVWLSRENEFNFKAAYDLAAMSGGATLPVTFKLGEQDGKPVYYTFEDMATLTDFYTTAIGYINQCLQEGWAKKDAAKEWVQTLGLKNDVL